jgi:bifunctional DNA-binding transcriptional regulator/antitoxin component of YhaV-PrlF toxin-antitoxin module
MSTLVGTKGQVTIEKEIRQALGVRPGWRAVQRLDGDRVVIEFLPPKHRRSLLGILSDKTTVRIPSDEEFQAAVERAWEEAVREDWEAQAAPGGEGAIGDRRAVCEIASF